MLTNFKIPKIKGDNSDCYIHFTDKEKLETFITNYKDKLNLGHRCCYGKGCHIKTFENKEITDYVQIHTIQKTYQKTYQLET